MPVKVRGATVAEGAAGTRQLMAEMLRIARTCSRDPKVKAISDAILERSADPYSEPANAHAIFAALKAAARYTPNPVNTQLLQDVEAYVKNGLRGSCADAAIATYTLGSWAGIKPAGLLAFGPHGDRRATHVATAYRMKNGRADVIVPVDVLGTCQLGELPANLAIKYAMDANRFYDLLPQPDENRQQMMEMQRAAEETPAAWSPAVIPEDVDEEERLEAREEPERVHYVAAEEDETKVVPHKCKKEPFPWFWILLAAGTGYTYGKEKKR